jgi:hypothetical protein
MDFAKFLSLLETNSLYFCTLRTLAEKYDYYEGYFPVKELKHGINQLPPSLSIESSRRLEAFNKLYSSWKDSILVNCWHMNDYESDAMWKIYSLRGQGIAIQSTFGKLCDSFITFNKVVNIIPVEYVNYEAVNKSIITNIFWIGSHKREVFNHEKEIRAIILNKKLVNNASIPIKVKNGGRYILISVNTLIESVYIAPSSPEWYKKLIEKIIRKYKINAPIINSEIDKKP